MRGFFVFINQFELKTNFKNCLDSSTGTFTREINVHYSIYNVGGEQVGGDVITTQSPTSENDMDEIVKDNFPKLSRQITREMPRGARTKDRNYQMEGTPQF